MTAADGTGLAVARLMVTDFRSYARAVVDLGETVDPALPIVLTGANGAGKTNLLEAVSYLSSGRGLRRARLGDVTRHAAAGGWAVAARLATPDGMVDIGTGLAAAPGAASAVDGEDDEDDSTASAARRVVRLNGVPATGPAALAELCAVTWATPAMDRLFIEGASGRRRFLDRLALALGPDHARQLAGYERAMRERTRLLTNRGAAADASWLAALEARMAEHGLAIAAARRETVARLAAQVAETEDGPFPRADLAIAGRLEEALDGSPALAVEEDFRALLADLRRRDGDAGRATEGPHRSDLKVVHAPKAMPAELCSTGEQKALLIGLVLAHARARADLTGVAPILLLDEIAAHLDASRRAALFEQLRGLGSQAWLTGTDRALFASLDGQACFFTVADATVTREGKT